jgi:hypothetical protein
MSFGFTLRHSWWHQPFFWFLFFCFCFSEIFKKVEKGTIIGGLMVYAYDITIFSSKYQGQIHQSF